MRFIRSVTINRHSCDGQLFRERYKSIVVESDSYALELVTIHRNPLEAGLVDNLQKYQWSTHKNYLSDSKHAVLPHTALQSIVSSSGSARC